MLSGGKEVEAVVVPIGPASTDSSQPTFTSSKVDPVFSPLNSVSGADVPGGQVEEPKVPVPGPGHTTVVVPGGEDNHPGDTVTNRSNSTESWRTTQVWFKVAQPNLCSPPRRCS